jgi:hypothetical protein
MRGFDEFAQEAQRIDLRLRVNPERLDEIAKVSGEGLFHVPILALSILLIARARKKSFATADVAVWTAATLSRHFSRLAGVRSKMEWSVPHRKRCAEALMFLEGAQLIRVEDVSPRYVECTPIGVTFVRDLLARSDEIGFLTKRLERSYRGVEHHGIGLL